MIPLIIFFFALLFSILLVGIIINSYLITALKKGTINITTELVLVVIVSLLWSWLYYLSH